MSDNDETIYSGGQVQDEESSAVSSSKKRNPLLIIGGIGCLLLLCAALLIGGGVYFVGDQVNDLVAQLSGESDTPDEVETTEPESSPTSTPTEVVEEVEPEEEEVEATEEPTPEPTEAPEEVDTSREDVLPAVPEFGEITFALDATDNYEPIDAGDSFEEGVTEIHAIFDYNGMAPEYTWDRIWYLDGEEVLNNSADWTGDSEGRFDYFIDAGGAPLAPGEWQLELYVEDELLTTGSFVIEAEEEAVAEADTPTPTATRAPSPTPTPTQATSASSGGSGGGTYDLAFTKWDGGQHNLYVADTNGNNERFLFGRAAGPSWTPDGNQIYFFGEEGVDRQIAADGREFVFDGVSNGIIVLTNASSRPNLEQVALYQGIDWKQGSGRWASVSPDGQMVAFDAKPGGDYRIYFLGTADNQQFVFEIVGEQADWSPDSQQIVYRSGRDGRTGVWISNRDDSGHTLITDGGSDSFPAWSPNGRTIAFSRDQGGNVDIYTVNVDGTNLQRLTDAEGPDTLPIYTPSGDIIFRSARTGSWGVWKMSGSGGNQTEIIPNAGVGPDWSFSKMSIN